MVTELPYGSRCGRYGIVLAEILASIPQAGNNLRRQFKKVQQSAPGLSMGSRYEDSPSFRIQWDRRQSCSKRNTQEERWRWFKVTFLQTVGTVRWNVIGTCGASATKWPMARKNENISGVTFDGPLIPFGARVSCKSISSKDESRLHSVKKMFAGIFTGYVLRAGRGWTGEPVITDCKHVEE